MKRTAKKTSAKKLLSQAQADKPEKMAQVHKSLTRAMKAYLKDGPLESEYHVVADHLLGSLVGLEMTLLLTVFKERLQRE